MKSKTKIIATIGPSSSSKDILREMVNSIDLARLNFSFGDYNFHEQNINNIRELSSELNKNIAILQDIQGPKIRVTKILNQEIDLKYEHTLIILPEQNMISNPNEISISYPNLYQDVKPKDKILMADGSIELEVTKIEEKKIFCKVIQGGVLKEKKGLNVPIKLNIPAITDKDERDIKFGLKQGIDYIALSFVRSPEDILHIRSLFNVSKEPELQPSIIAKIERPEAVENLEEIIKVSDGIMVARGDLGIELPYEKIPLIQKNILELCRDYSKPVIIATQMLFSMVHSIRPTRAEVADIFNAVMGGADALMLSDETAVGEHPIKVVNTFNKIITEAEKEVSPIYNPPTKKDQVLDTAHAVANAACELAEVVNAKAIVSFTKSGFTALLISKNRPKVDIVAITPEESVLRKMALYWGVLDSTLKPNVKDADDIIKTSQKVVLDKGLAKSRDLIIITAGLPFAYTGITNLIKVHKIE
jgi:pyruvate kinase